MKRGNKAGVSPVIATVLLVAIVMVIALIIFLWFRGFTQEAILKFDKNIELVCEDVVFEASLDNGDLVISNIGNVPIYGMKIKIIGDGSYDTKDLKDEGFDGLSSGGIYNEGIGSLIDGDTEEIILIPVLRGMSNLGEENYVCEGKNYEYSLLI